MELYIQLKEAREKAGYTQEELAKELNVSRQAISRWETGKSYPDIDNLVKLSGLYQVTLDELMLGKKENIKEENIEEVKNEEGKFEAFFILATALISCTVPIVGLILTLGLVGYCLVKKRKFSVFFWIIMITCIIVNIINAGVILNNTVFDFGRATIEKVARS